MSFTHIHSTVKGVSAEQRVDSLTEPRKPYIATEYPVQLLLFNFSGF